MLSLNRLELKQCQLKTMDPALISVLTHLKTLVLDLCDFPELDELLPVILSSKSLQKFALRKGTFKLDTLCYVMEHLPSSAPALKSLSLLKASIS